MSGGRKAPAMTAKSEVEGERSECRVRQSLLAVLDRIKQPGKTELPDSSFSAALNAVGERFIDCLLGKARTGEWWLEADGRWHECTIQRWGENREPRVFLPANHPSWECWFPKTATRLADPLTGPDHVVSVQVASRSQPLTVVLEKKLRLSKRQDAIATPRTYVSHLRAKPLDYRKLERADHQKLDDYCAGLLNAIRLVLTPKRIRGAICYAGKVPHVVYASALTAPNLIHVSDSKLGVHACSHAGFLAPVIDRRQFTDTNPYAGIVRRSAVHLWLGLDELLQQCKDAEVEAAWNDTLTWLTESVCNPQWRNETAEDVEAST
jgi:hypothetical protein